MTISESQTVLKNIDGALKTPAARREISRIESVLILSTFWYPEIIEGLKKSARNFFQTLDLSEDKLIFVDVPGALELPYAARMGAAGRLSGQRTKPDCIVVLGCVQKGETPHFDFVCQTAFQALMEIQLRRKVAMGIGLLTVNNLEEARARINKGQEAAQAALFMRLSTMRRDS